VALEPSSLELIGRIAISAGLTAVIGLERELTGHPAGIRTHAIVGIGSTLFTVAGAYGFGASGAGDSPGRIAAQVVTGIGFLGAGTILRHRDRVKGLTTAATLWLAAGIGVSIGAGLVAVTLGAVAMTLVVLLAVHITDPIFRRFRERHGEPASSDDGPLPPITAPESP
jgi:putative Mg2+ transporter-C (MgtC) family protein